MEEIRLAGRGTHLRSSLEGQSALSGGGPIDFKAVIDALADVGFKGWAQLETDSPASLEADMQRNLKFIRGLLAARNAGENRPSHFSRKKSSPTIFRTLELCWASQKGSDPTPSWHRRADLISLE